MEVGVLHGQGVNLDQIERPADIDYGKLLFGGARLLAALLDRQRI